jgi:putative transposase
MKQLVMALEEPKKRVRRGGRKPTRGGTWMPHRRRPWHDKNCPVHVTIRVKKGVPNLRGFKLAAVIGAGMRRAATGGTARVSRRRETFRVVHFSIQPNHIHMIVEATSSTALARGMQGLASGLARRVNRKLGRRGALFSDRYHAHALSSPMEVRNAIVYCLKNYEKHPVAVPDRSTMPQGGIDPCSSARWFGGWAESPPAPTDPPPVAEPRTWLLRTGWLRHGAVHRHERPTKR